MAYPINLRFADNVPASLRTLATAAAERWAALILLPAPLVTLADGTSTRGVEVEVSIGPLDNSSGRLAQTQLRELRNGSLLPASATLAFDNADLGSPLLAAAALHEMGHVLGFGSLQIGQSLGLVTGLDTDDPVFTGSGCVAAYAALLGQATDGVPLENTGADGTRGRHWRKARFGPELMTGSLANGPAPLSQLSIAALGDLGYAVDTGYADFYRLPGLPRRLLQALKQVLPLNETICTCEGPELPATVLPKSAEVSPTS